MPSCCRGITCECRITEGADINVAGSGSAADPFVISFNRDMSGYDTITAREDAIDAEVIARNAAIAAALAASGGWTVVHHSGPAGYLAQVGEYVVVDATAGACVVTLDTTGTTGGQVGVKKVDASANVVTVLALGPTIDGDPDATLPAQWSGGTFMFEGTDWIVSGGM